MTERIFPKEPEDIQDINLPTGQSDYWDARAIYDCLSYLESEAKQANLNELAHLIGVAAASAEETTRSLSNRSKPH